MIKNIEPAYKDFTHVVTRAVNSVENKSYGYSTFFNIVDLQMDNTGMYDINHEINTFNPNEEVDYEGFSKAVSKIVISAKNKKHQETFNTINELIDVYAIPRHKTKENHKTLQKARF